MMMKSIYIVDRVDQSQLQDNLGCLLRARLASHHNLNSIDKVHCQGLSLACAWLRAGFRLLLTAMLFYNNMRDFLEYKNSSSGPTSK